MKISIPWSNNIANIVDQLLETRLYKYLGKSYTASDREQYIYARVNSVSDLRFSSAWSLFLPNLSKQGNGMQEAKKSRTIKKIK